MIVAFARSLSATIVVSAAKVAVAVAPKKNNIHPIWLNIKGAFLCYSVTFFCFMRLLL
jgi:hypothetical protein